MGPPPGASLNGPTARDWAHRLLALLSVPVSLWVVVAAVTGISYSGDFHTHILLTPSRTAGFVGFLGVVLFFPPVCAVLQTWMAFSRKSDGLVERWFGVTSGLLYVIAAVQVPELPRPLLLTGAALFVAASLLGRIEETPRLVATTDRLHQVVGGALLISSLAFATWWIFSLSQLADLSSVWKPNDTPLLLEGLFPGIAAACGMLINNHFPTIETRQQGRVGVRILCLISAATALRLAFNGWGLSGIPAVAQAVVLLVAAAIPWKEPLRVELT